MDTTGAIMVLPMPYQQSRVGEGSFPLTALAMNLGGTYTDVFGLRAGRQPSRMGRGGLGCSFSIPAPLSSTSRASSSASHRSRTTISGHCSRESNDYSYVQSDQYGFTGGRLTATSRTGVRVYGGGYLIGSQFDKILDQNSNIIYDIEGHPRSGEGLWLRHARRSDGRLL